MATIGLDLEVFSNFFLVGMKRFEDGKRLSMELSVRSDLDRKRLLRILRDECIVTFNGMTYDIPILCLAIEGASLTELKTASDRIIHGRLMWWEVESELGIHILKIDHIDLFEVNPSIRSSLKTLNGRLHGKVMMDLPFKPEAVLTDEQKDQATHYNANDLDATHLLFDALKEPLALREALSKQYDIDMRSKSDAQIGEAIIRKRVKDLTGNTPKKSQLIAGSSFHYAVPPFLTFEGDRMREIVEMLRAARFFIGPIGKVLTPPTLKNLKVQIGDMVYKMGIGGLHSTEAHRAVHSDDDDVLVDADVASQYPAILLKLGLYPKAVGSAYLDVGRALMAERIVAKRVGDKVKSEGGKIALNGAFYGKTGSPHSFLFAPHIMIATTLTGQLSLLMLIERAVRAGIPVVSGNTDGVVFKCPRDMVTFNDKGNVSGGMLGAIIRQWEADTGFEAETVRYRSIYNASVNTYMAIKEDGKAKRKGSIANPWKDNDLREMMKKNPQMTICSDAVLALITDGTPIERTIQECDDVRAFVTVIKVTGGATWRGEYLAKVVRYIWSTDGDPILYAQPNESTGNFKKVSKTDGARPLMELPDELPDDIDYARYIEEAREIARDLAVIERPVEMPKLRAKASDMRLGLVQMSLWD